MIRHRTARSQRTKRFFILFAHLAVLAYVFQMLAIDHWHTDPNSIAGVPGSSQHTAQHASHCHGSTESCADGGGGMVGTLSEHELALILPGATRVELAPITPATFEVLVPQPAHPPRSL